MRQFLPVSRREIRERGISRPDFVYIIGDAYVDHPSFGHAVISRVLEANGYSVAILSQPDWKKKESIAEFGEPRLGFLVTAGNMDSMVNHYTVFGKRRKKDAYTPGGAVGKRPDRATIVYCNLIRQTFKKTPVIIGGIEASLRRLAHYDYWSDTVRRSILLDAGADLLLYGMGERSIVEVAQGLDAGIDIRDLTYIDGTVYRAKDKTDVCDGLLLPSYDEVRTDKRTFAESFYTQYQNTDAFTARRLIEPYGEHLYVIQNPPSKPLSTEEMDAVYSLPYVRACHPSCDADGGVAAVDEVKFSLTSCRGCFGGCNFCSLTFHQGRIIQARSHESILREARELTKDPDFKGYIHDVGGPTANFRAPSCEKQLRHGVCTDRQCLFPDPCKNLRVDHTDYLELLRKLRALPKVKKVFIRSGIRFDYLLCDADDTFFRELCEYHVSGQLKVAPEHVSNHVLDKMGKPPASVYDRFAEKYKCINKQLGKKQFLVPYLMSSHPGSTLKDAVKLAEYLRDWGYMPEQVQDFYPTPSTMSTCMYYTGLDPRTMERVYVAASPHEKAMQRALIQYRDPKNYDLVSEALYLTHRTDLIGYGDKCLIRPRRQKTDERAAGKQKKCRKTSAASFNDGGRPAKKKTIRNVHKKKH